MSKDTTGPAFPCDRISINGGVVCAPGLTRREWFAGLAMQGMHSNPNQSLVKKERIAEAAFAMADAMIEEGKK